jgi:hypothetical protein
MTRVHSGRWTARPDGCGAVFLIGMRLNKPWRVEKWGPVSTAMPRMLAYLRRHPEAGMLGGQSWFGRTLLLVSYWRSADDLVRFAAASEAPHREAWKAFNRAVGAVGADGADGAVGVWHETYVLGDGGAEAVYVNMPRFGLAAATQHEPVASATGTARKRLARASLTDSSR